MQDEQLATLSLRLDALRDQPDQALVTTFAALVKSPELGSSALALLAQQKCDPARVMELVLQSFLFAGFPRCINGLVSFRRSFGEAVPSKHVQAADSLSLREKGLTLFQRIYGHNTQKVLAALDECHEELQDWILEDAYGKILSRPALEPSVRELCAVAGLLVSGDMRQLSSHVRGALNCGASAVGVRSTINNTSFLYPEERHRTALEVLSKIAAGS